MTRGIEPISPEATVQEAAVCMAEHDIGAVLVGSKHAIDGVLTDRDILLRVVVEGRNPSSIRVREVMSSSLFTCREDDEIDWAFQQMSEHQIRRLPVLDESGHLVGIVTLGDLTKKERDPRQALEALRTIAEPHRGKAGRDSTR